MEERKNYGEREQRWWEGKGGEEEGTKMVGGEGRKREGEEEGKGEGRSNNSVSEIDI